MAATTLTFNKNTDTGMYECTYTGESGAFQARTASRARMTFFGNAGVGYDLLENGCQCGTDFLFYLDMTGLNSMKIVSTEAVSSAVVNA